MNKQDLKSKIEKLEKGIASKVTPENLKASLKSQKEKFEKELADLEKKEKSDLSKKIKDLKASVKTKSTSSSTSRDGARKAKKAGKRIAEDGSVYYEKRANRTDSQTSKKPYLEEGGYMNDGGDLESFEKKVKDAMKQPNKWYFIADYVGDKKVQLKMFVGVKEVDVQIFKIDGLHAKMPRNYSGRRDTLKMIMDNFEPKMAKGGELNKRKTYSVKQLKELGFKQVQGDKKYRYYFEKDGKVNEFKVIPSVGINSRLVEEEDTMLAMLSNGGKLAKGGDLYDDMDEDIEFANKKAKMIANSLKGMGYNIVEFTEADYDADANISLSETPKNNGILILKGLYS